jgi:primosomal protein N' (replication factor Y)
LYDGANALTVTLRHVLGENVLGPEPPLIPRIQNQYILELLVKLKRDKNIVRIKEFIGRSILMMKQNKETASINISIDVDPY